MAGQDKGDRGSAGSAGDPRVGRHPADQPPAGVGSAAAGPPPVDRRLLDEIFGDVLPETTGDERDPGGDAGYSEQWYRENRPPHHGG